MLVRANTPSCCMPGDIDAAIGTTDIKKSVGAGGANLRPDVVTIQQLLNGVAPADGGPLPILAEDGIAGPLTNGAIRKFQQVQQLPAVDGRVDPNGPTLRRLNEVSTPGQRAIQQMRAVLGLDVPAVRHLAGLDQATRRALRFKRAELAMPELIRVSREGQRKAEQSMDHVSLGTTLPGSGNAEAFRRAELHFKFGNQSKAKTVDELGFIRTTLRRVNGVLNNPRPSVFGGNPFGLSIFEIDPTGKRPDWFAFTPTQAFDFKRKDGLSSGHVYLCDQLDYVTQDLLVIILLHELFHFVDEESKERKIFDAPDGYREGAFKLTHDQRMHSADNYALFTSHVGLGRARVVAALPTLDGPIPKDMP